jgi:hypothetical protein
MKGGDVNALYLASGLALMAAAGHSYLSERLVLGPLRSETLQGGVFSGAAAKKLASAMFHLASLCWAGMAISMLLLESSGAEPRATLHIYATIYAVSGLGNFWATGRPHPGGVMLLAAGALILVALHA